MLEQLYEDWITAEAFEQACLVMLGVNDSVEMHAQYEIAVERRDDALAAYEAALAGARSVAAA